MLRLDIYRRSGYILSSGLKQCKQKEFSLSNFF